VPDCRFVAHGGMAPLLSAAAAARHAATFAQGCCYRTNMDMYQAPLIRLLRRCSAALSADMLRAAAPTAPATADAVAAAEESTGCARPNALLSAGQLGADTVQQAGQQHSEQPDPEWESDWADPVGIVLQVGQMVWHADDHTAGGTMFSCIKGKTKVSGNCSNACTLACPTVSRFQDVGAMHRRWCCATGGRDPTSTWTHPVQWAVLPRSSKRRPPRCSP
jgi:hypothetical protein